MAGCKAAGSAVLRKAAALVACGALLASTHAHAQTDPTAPAPPATARPAYVPDALRLETISYRLARANSQFCDEGQRLSGLMLHDIGGFAKATRPAAVRAYGLTYGFGVTQLVPDSAATRAGFAVGDEIVAVNGIDLADFARETIGPRASYSRTERFVAFLDAALRLGPVVLTVRRGQTPIILELVGDAGCGGKPTILQSRKLNAWSDGRYVALTTRMMRFVEDDAELAFVIAHEMAHNILHYGSGKRGAAVQAALGDRASGAKSAEIEADRFAIELMARAGYDLDAAERFFLRAAKARRLVLSISHPTSSRRILFVNTAIADIQRSRALAQANIVVTRPNSASCKAHRADWSFAANLDWPDAGRSMRPWSGGTLAISLPVSWTKVAPAAPMCGGSFAVRDILTDGLATTDLLADAGLPAAPSVAPLAAGEDKPLRRSDRLATARAERAFSLLPLIPGTAPNS